MNKKMPNLNHRLVAAVFAATLCVSVPAAAATCEPGYYLPANTVSCATCPNGYYCVGGTFAQSATDQGKTACPAADSATQRTTFSDRLFPYDSATGTYDHSDVPKIKAFTRQVWGYGWSSIDQCVAYYRLSNAAYSWVAADNVAYNTATGKYDRDYDIYYGGVNNGYYLDTIYSTSYCGYTSNSMLYRRAIICPAGYYCRGGAVPQCSSGEYKSEWGRVVCPAGHYCPAGAGAPTPCPAGTYSNVTGASDASICKACTNAPTNASYIDNATTNSCPWECDDGYGRHNNECVPLCAADMRHLKTSNGLQFNLYPVAYSNPALHVKRGNTICYGVLVQGSATNTININYHGQIYHMVD